MSQYTEILGLDLQALKNLADAHSGYANYLNTMEKERYTAYIASSFLIAATLYALDNPPTSVAVFQDAARFYRRDNNSFWKIAAVCGNNSKTVDQTPTEEETSKATYPDDQFAEMLAQQFVYSANGELDLSFGNSVFLSLPVGRLGLPMRVYTNAFLEIAELADSKVQREMRLEAWTILLSRAAERTRILKADIYHWKNLKGTFIPLEPEVLAACMSLCRFLKARHLNIGDLLEGLSIDRIAIIPLLVAKDIIDPPGYFVASS